MTIGELLDRPEKWTRGATARNSKGWVQRYFSPKATCWCLLGACYRCGIEEGSVQYKRLISTIKAMFPDRTFADTVVVGAAVVSFNDDPATCFADIRAVIEAAGV